MGIIIGIIYLVLMGLFGSNIIKHLILLITTNQYLLIALYILSFTVIIELITIPLSFYGGFVLEHIYNLSNQKLSGWAKDELKKSLVSLMLIIIMIEIMYIFLRNFPNSWWIFIAIIWVLFSVIMAKLAPVLIFPLFYKSVPLENEEVKVAWNCLQKVLG